MRSIKRPLVATGTAVLMALSFAACGDDGDGEAGDDATSEATESGSGEPSDASGATEGSDATDGSEGAGGSDGPDGSSSGGAGGVGTATTEEFCAGVLDVVAVSTPVTSSKPNAEEWGKIQDAYADLGEIGAPTDIPAREGEGFEILVESITSLSYAEAEKAFGSAEGTGIPGVSEEDNDKVTAFYVWAGAACPELSGGAGSGGGGTGGTPAE